MSKKIFSGLIMISILFILCGTVFAQNTIYTTTSTINDVTVNWEYELNDSNQIENLKCLNPADLTGKVLIPSTLDGKSVVSLGDSAFKSATKITEIAIPTTVKEIGLRAFLDCTSLAKVNLGTVEKISDQSFRNCTALTSIKLPKTLKKDASGAPFLGCTNLKNIELEDGMTVVPNYVCAGTPITEITIPGTVKKIGLWAFSGCTSLSNVNLGNVESICDQSFKNCTALTSIKLPKTLNEDASGAPFLGCTNLKNIELEEGMTNVPNYVCASTPITEIIIPSTVKRIGLWTFKNCTSLKKITILDNVTDMGGYKSSNTDLMFENHSADLTIYCYKDSMAANYAIKYNIKYVYLAKPSKGDDTPSTDDDNNKNNVPVEKPTNSTQNTSTNNNQEDNTIATGKLPKAGNRLVIIIGLILGGGISIVMYKRYNRYRDI